MSLLSNLVTGRALGQSFSSEAQYMTSYVPVGRSAVQCHKISTWVGRVQRYPCRLGAAATVLVTLAHTS